MKSMILLYHSSCEFQLSDAPLLLSYDSGPDVGRQHDQVEDIETWFNICLCLMPQMIESSGEYLVFPMDDNRESSRSSDTFGTSISG